MRENPVISEREIDSLLEEFNGNARATIKALMHDLVILVDRNNESGSRGFLRKDHRMMVPWGRDGERRAEVA